MVIPRRFFVSLGLLFTVLACPAAEELLVENFDSLAPEGIAGQGSWADNSKLGTALIVADDSLSTPHHLEVSQGGAVHRAIPPVGDSSGVVTLEFAFKRRTSHSGNNLQISLRGKGGEPVLFVNVRGSGKSLDVGPSVDELTGLPLEGGLPEKEWCRLKIAWSPATGDVQVRLLPLGDAHPPFDSSLAIPASSFPRRIIIGSTSSAIASEGWAVDDLRVSVQP